MDRGVKGSVEGRRLALLVVVLSVVVLGWNQLGSPYAGSAGDMHADRRPTAAPGEVKRAVPSSDPAGRREAAMVRTLRVVDHASIGVAGAHLVFTDGRSKRTATTGEDGSARIPLSGWTHVLINARNYLPVVFERHDKKRTGDETVVQLPAPSLTGIVTAPAGLRDRIELWVEEPFVDTGSWPKILRPRQGAPIRRVTLRPDDDGAVFFAGATDSSLTLLATGPLMFSERGKLVRRVVRGNPSLGVRITLAAAPTLEARLVAVMPRDRGRHVNVRFDLTSKDGTLTTRLTPKKSVRHIFSGLSTSRGTATNLPGPWPAVGGSIFCPFAPEMTTARITVSDARSQVILARTRVRLAGESRSCDIAIETASRALRIVGPNGRPVAGARIVQSGRVIAVSDRRGVAHLELAVGGGSVSFLALGHDIVSHAPADLVGRSEVRLPFASGFRLTVSGFPDGFPTRPLSLSVSGFQLPSVVCEASQIVEEVYGIDVQGSVQSEETFVEDTQLEQPWQTNIGPSNIACTDIVVVVTHNPAVITSIFGAPPAGGRVAVLSLSGSFDAPLATARARLSRATITDVRVDVSDRVRLFRGTVVDAATGRPVAGARISFDDVAADDACARSSRDGSFSLLGAMSNSACVRAAGYVPRYWDRPPQDARYPLHAARSLVIEITDALGMRATAKVVLESSDGVAYPGVVRSPGLVEFAVVPATPLLAKVTRAGTTRQFPVGTGKRVKLIWQ